MKRTTSSTEFARSPARRKRSRNKSRKTFRVESGEAYADRFHHADLLSDNREWNARYSYEIFDVFDQFADAGRK